MSTLSFAQNKASRWITGNITITTNASVIGSTVFQSGFYMQTNQAISYKLRGATFNLTANSAIDLFPLVFAKGETIIIVPTVTTNIAYIWYENN